MAQFDVFIAQFQPLFPQLPVPITEIDGSTLKVEADPAVSVIGLDVDNRVDNSAKFKFDPTVNHIMRLLTVQGRLTIGEWSATTRAWTWKPVMQDLITSLEKMYNSGNTWAEAIALIGTFVTLYLLKRLKDMKKAQNADDTQKQRATDQATNRTENQALDDQMKAGTDQVDKVLDKLDAEISTPPDKKDPTGNM